MHQRTSRHQCVCVCVFQSAARRRLLLRPPHVRRPAYCSVIPLRALASWSLAAGSSCCDLNVLLRSRVLRGSDCRRSRTSTNTYLVVHSLSQSHSVHALITLDTLSHAHVHLPRFIRVRSLLASQSVSQPVGQSVSQSARQSVSQSVSQSVRVNSAQYRFHGSPSASPLCRRFNSGGTAPWTALSSTTRHRDSRRRCTILVAI
jgi:hypothetical protein